MNRLLPLQVQYLPSLSWHRLALFPSSHPYPPQKSLKTHSKNREEEQQQEQRTSPTFRSYLKTKPPRPSPTSKPKSSPNPSHKTKNPQKPNNDSPLKHLQSHPITELKSNPRRNRNFKRNPLEILGRQKEKRKQKGTALLRNKSKSPISSTSRVRSLLS